MPRIRFKTHNSAAGYPAAAGVFEQLTALFVAAPSATAPRIARKNLKATLDALDIVSAGELVAVRAVLSEVSSRIDRILNQKAPLEERREAEKVDARVARALADARSRHYLPAPAASPDTEAAVAAFMAEMRRGSAAALQRRIAHKELLPPKEFQEALNIRRQSISDAVKAGRMFAMVGPSGENYYPAFYADGALDRRPLERVTKALGPLPAASKYFFFTAKSVFLGGATPLEALKHGRLADVLSAAAGFTDR